MFAFGSAGRNPPGGAPLVHMDHVDDGFATGTVRNGLFGNGEASSVLRLGRAASVVGGLCVLALTVMGSPVGAAVATGPGPSAPGSVAGATAIAQGGGFTLDGFGGLHAFRVGTGSPPPAVSGGGYWPGWDIARGLTLFSDGSGGYLLDGVGGLHALGVGGGAPAPAVTGAPYWPGWDIARGVAVLPDRSGGYIVDGFGGLHPFGIGTASPPPAAVGGPYWLGQDIASSVVLTAAGTGGYVLDRTGALHPFAVGPSGTTPGPVTGLFRSSNLRVWGVGLIPGSPAGYTLDGFGGLHPFALPGGTPPVAATGAAAWPAWDIARDVALTPPPDALRAAIAVSPTSGAAPLTVKADASGSTDQDATPIASYSFDFGDGTIVGPQSKATASHVYPIAGSFTVTVTVTDTAGHVAAVTNPAPVSVDAPPAATLLVAPEWSVAPLAVSADASGSTDTDPTPIASYRFDFGDGTVVGPQSGAKATHTYGAEGTYDVTVTVTDTAHLNSRVTRTIDVAAPSASSVSVFAGYYDTHHPNNPRPKPSPWAGSANTLFVGQADAGTGGWDSSAVRVQNNTAAPMTLTVTVQIGKHTYDIWGAQTLAAGQNLVLAQMGYETFDGSDTSTAGCYSCDPVLCTTSVSDTVPIINVTVGGVTTHYSDTGQVLNTGGVDSAGCPYTGKRSDESEPWSAVPGPG